MLLFSLGGLVYLLLFSLCFVVLSDTKFVAFFCGSSMMKLEKYMENLEPEMKFQVLFVFVPESVV